MDLEEVLLKPTLAVWAVSPVPVSEAMDPVIAITVFILFLQSSRVSKQSEMTMFRPSDLPMKFKQSMPNGMTLFQCPV